MARANITRLVNDHPRAHSELVPSAVLSANTVSLTNTCGPAGAGCADTGPGGLNNLGWRAPQGHMQRGGDVQSHAIPLPGRASRRPGELGSLADSTQLPPSCAYKRPLERSGAPFRPLKG